ncbi:transcription elongation factor GreA [Ferruginivarius sediminum]|uniref:Transcription elongation factor GreA n=1 Tax=Ferruginivarius sediminum TaxID=2661937 RepID=A0A369TD23_9PROT|nr:transcription elongation factor GreA [Ferruginivarius sediminum]RDD62722.1 transcription elongation factor GreA [Ferruginivarius sediminum]
MSKKIPMTAQGYAQIEEELRHLRSNARPEVIKAIAEAREHGDLSENAEYHAARDRQSFIEGRVAELEDQMARAEVIDVSKLSGNTVKFGATVTLADEDTDEETTYQIVGEIEADVKGGRIAVTSPIARAIIGKSVGDSVEVETPKGQKFFEIVDVDYK